MGALILTRKCRTILSETCLNANIFSPRFHMDCLLIEFSFQRLENTSNNRLSHGTAWRIQIVNYIFMQFCKPSYHSLCSFQTYSFVYQNSKTSAWNTFLGNWTLMIKDNIRHTEYLKCNGVAIVICCWLYRKEERKEEDLLRSVFILFCFVNLLFSLCN